MHQWSNGKTRAPQFSEKARDPGSIQALFKKALERKSFFFPQGFFFSKEKGLGKSRLVHF